MSYIAEQAGGFACIGRDGKLYIKKIGESVIDLDIERFQNFTWGDAFLISKIAYEDGVNDFKVSKTERDITVEFVDNETVKTIDELLLGDFTDEAFNTVWINSDNMYIVDREQIENIFNSYQNFGCVSFDGTTIIDPAIDVGDIVIIEGRPVIYQGAMEYVGKFKASISSEIQVKNKEENMTTKISTSKKIRRVQGSIDQINGEITLLAQETDDNSEAISQLQVTTQGITTTVSNVSSRVQTIENTSISSVDVKYALGTSTTTAPTTGWSTIAPQWQQGKYMWQKTDITYANGTTETGTPTCISGAKGDTGATGSDGDTGIGVSAIEEQYYLSTSNTTQTGGSWKTTQDAWQIGKYIWTRSKITWTDNTITYTTPVLATGINNANSVATNANSTANTANTNAQTALNKANENEGKINTNITKISQIEQTVNGITSRVSATETTLTTVQGDVATAQSTANSANSKVDNLQIGGRNFLVGTATAKSKTVNSSSSYVTFDPYKTENNQTLEDLGLQTGDEVTVSLDWKISQNGSLDYVYGNFRLEWLGSSGYLGVIKNPAVTFSSSNTSGKVIVTIKLTATTVKSYAVRIRIDNSVLNLTVSRMKLEVGNMATDWTPAPEDIENTLQTNYYTKTETESKIDQKADTITSTVSQTYSTKTETATAKTEAINSANSATDTKLQDYSTTSTVQSMIRQTASSIDLSVSNNSTTAGITITLKDGNGNTLNTKSGTINMTGLVKFTDLSTSGSTTINGDNITTGHVNAEHINMVSTANNLMNGIHVSSPNWLAGLVSSPSGQNSNPIIYFGAFNTAQMGTPPLSVGAEFWENGEAYIRRLYCESGAESGQYMAYIKTTLSTSSNSINYIVNGTSKINVNTYNGQSFDIYASTSDEQLKENIVDSKVNALDAINKIRLISFNWKDSGEYQAMGFSAQQLKTVCEDFVSSVKQPENSEYDEILQVRDFNMQPYIIGAIQELNKKLEDIENKL